MATTKATKASAEKKKKDAVKGSKVKKPKTTTPKADEPADSTDVPVPEMTKPLVKSIRLEQLLEHNEFFDMLVDMIPSKLYISGESGDDYNPRVNKYHKGEAAADSKQARKLQAKTAKRRKLDPEMVETTVQIKARLEQRADDDDDADDNDDVDEEPHDNEEADEPSDNDIDEPANHEPKQEKTEKVKPPQSEPQPLEPDAVAGQSRIEALRAKLHAKIAERSNGHASGTATSQEQVSKRAARRVEKNRRKEEAKRKAKNASTSATTSTNAQPKSYVVTPTDATLQQDLQHIDYGRLTGLDTAAMDTSNYTKANKALQSLSKGKNLHKLLADAEAKRIKLQQLAASTSAADKEKAALMEWTDTFKEADGVRVKDDPARLKKAIKRKEATKKKSSTAWKARMEQVSTSAKNRQDIRKHNIAARKQGGSLGANLSSQKIKDTTAEKKDGRRLSRAGFEGRKQDFLNSSKTSNTRNASGGAPAKKK